MSGLRIVNTAELYFKSEKKLTLSQVNKTKFSVSLFYFLASGSL